jgi:hypothetical protein
MPMKLGQARKIDSVDDDQLAEGPIPSPKNGEMA